MKLNRKNFFAIFTAIGMQTVFGINLANAMPCEAEQVLNNAQ